MILEFHIKCELCGNKRDEDFYYMPLVEQTADGLVYSFLKYKLVCKKCNHEVYLELKEFKKE